MNILVINSSFHGDQSVSRALVSAFLEGLAGDSHDVVERDLAADPLPHLSKEAADAIRGEPGAQGADTSESDRLIAELEAADLLVLGAPMYNFTVPSTLKTWIDRVVRARRTFAYEDGQPRGLLDSEKKAVLCLSSDGIYSSGPTQSMDFVEPYLRTVLGFMGLTHIVVIRAEGQAIPDLGERKRQDALDAARSLAKTL